jgi:hypothetical protein
MSNKKIKDKFSLLHEAIDRNDMRSYNNLLFEVLSKTAVTFQLKLAVNICKKYLPIFNSRFSEDKFTSELLEKPEVWVKKYGARLSENHCTFEFQELDPSTASFISSLDAILWGHFHHKYPLIVTASSVTAILNYFSARGTIVWMADDPEAVIIWKSHKVPPRGRSLSSNVASLAVQKREKLYLLDKLKCSQLDIQNDINDEEIKIMLERWRVAEGLLLHPTTKGDTGSAW